MENLNNAIFNPFGIRDLRISEIKRGLYLGDEKQAKI